MSTVPTFTYLYHCSKDYGESLLRDSLRALFEDEM